MKRINGFFLSILLAAALIISCFAVPTVMADSVRIKDGTYYIWSKLNSEKAIDISGGNTSNGTNVQLYQFNSSNAQKFKITRNGSYYKITAVCSNKALDVAGGSAKSGTNVQQYKSNNSNAQKWQFIDAGGGYYYIKSALGTYLDVSGGKTANGTNIQAYRGNNSDSQKWRLLPADATYTTKTVTINATSLDDWCRQVAKAEQSMTGLSNGYTDPNSKFVYTGKVIVDKAIVSYKTITTKIPVVKQGPNLNKTYKTAHVKLPYKIKYVLHKCNIKFNANAQFAGNLLSGFVDQKVVLTQSCACGYTNKIVFEIPLPDPKDIDPNKVYTATSIRTYEKVR